MAVHKLVLVVVAVLCACALIVAGCGSSDAAGSDDTGGVSGLYPVSVDGKWGYIDSTGALKIQPQFDGGGPFSEGLAAVGVNENGVTKCGYIDETGDWVIQPQFDNARPFSGGVARVGRTDPAVGGVVWAYIDKTGKVIWQGE
jgi:hypothetical protein